MDEGACRRRAPRPSTVRPIDTGARFTRIESNGHGLVTKNLTQTRSSVRDILAQQTLLEYVPPVEIDRLAAVAETICYQTDQIVFRKGDPGTAVMYVLSGRVRISARSAEGREVVFGVMEPGEILGEIATIDGGERSADAVAVEPAELLLIDRNAFLRLLERNPQACLRLMEILCDRVRWTSEQVEDLNIFNLRPRLAKRLLSLCDRYGEPDDKTLRIAIRFPESALAGMMGSTREAVRRQLRSWTDLGIIDVEADCILIRNREGLERSIRRLSPLAKFE